MYESLILIHMVFGVAWAGGSLFVGLVLIPGLARAKPEEKGLALRMLPAVTPFMGSTSGMAMLTGLGLLWVTGRFSDFVSPGTLLGLFALVLVAVHGAYAGREVRTFQNLLETGDEARLTGFARRFSWIAIAVALIVVAIMSGYAIGHI